MLSFATEFPVKDCEAEAFVECVTKWLEGSPHTRLPKDQLRGLPNKGRWELRVGSEQVEALLSHRGTSSIAAFKHIISDEGLDWTTTIVFSQDQDGCWVGIRTSRESQQAQLGLPPAKKPVIVRTLLENLGGGLDGELYVSDAPHNLGPSDLGMATRLLNGDSDNYLPVVYISRGFDERLSIDGAALARFLGGVAHVVIEPSRQFSRLLQHETESRNVYGGRAGVYWPAGDYYPYNLDDYESEFDLRRTIGNRVRSALLHRRPLAKCTWARAEAEVARDAFEVLRSTGSADVEEYIRVFDAEIAAKNKQLDDAENEIRRLKADQRPYLTSQKSQGLLLSKGVEQEFFEGELLEIVLNALEAAANNAQEDSRRQHVLRAIGANNQTASQLKDRRDRLKEALRQYTNMGGNTLSELQSLGFEVADGGKHYKITYMGDDRYTFALPKSGSDYRGGLNAASDIGKRIY